MRVTEKGQVTIPKDVRERLGIVAGSEVDFVTDATGARLVVIASNSRPDPADFASWLRSVRGTFDTGGMTADQYIEWMRGPRDDLDPR